MMEAILCGSAAFCMVGFGCVLLAFAYDLIRDARA